MENNNTPLNGLPDNVDLSDIDMNEVILDLNEAKNGMNQLTDELKAVSYTHLTLPTTPYV